MDRITKGEQTIEQRLYIETRINDAFNLLSGNFKIEDIKLNYEAGDD